MRRIECSTCSTETTSYDERCSKCNTLLTPPPNVRMAEDRLPVLQAAYDALQPTCHAARMSELQQLTCTDGRIVVNMRATTLRSMLEHSDQQYGNFWEDLFANKIANRDKDRAGKRMAMDGQLFGQHALRVRCALLSFDGSGATHYGRYAVTLSLTTVAHRVSLLEDNPFNLKKLEHVPFLHRAVWENRGLLGAVKWGAAITAAAGQPILDVVQVRGACETGQHFVEAHVWGPFARAAFETITIHAPAKLTDLDVLDDQRIEELANNLGIRTARTVVP